MNKNSLKESIKKAASGNKKSAANLKEKRISEFLKDIERVIYEADFSYRTIEMKSGQLIIEDKSVINPQLRFKDDIAIGRFLND